MHSTHERIALDANLWAVKGHGNELSFKPHQILFLDVLGVVFGVETEVEIILRVQLDVVDPSSGLPENLVQI